MSQNSLETSVLRERNVCGSQVKKTVKKPKPSPYTKILLNRPIAPVKIRKFDKCMQEVCSCKESDSNPCGRYSNCINMLLKIECNDLCPAGLSCENQKLRKRDYVDLKIVETQDKGFGVVCVNDVAEKTFLIENVGELINTSELNKRMKAKIESKDKKFYFYSIEKDLHVDSETRGNLARFINHSCDPNCIDRRISVDGNTRIGIFSNQPIKAGTELTLDYQLVCKKMACFCKSVNCSGFYGTNT